MRKSPNLSYCAELVRRHHRDRFLQTLFVPAAAREALLALLALDAELAHVHHAVSEEMTGQLRYAWWQEALQGMAGGKPPRAHPVLETLPAESIPGCLKTAEIYRENFPNLPDNDAVLEETALAFIRSACPQAEAGWCRAKALIENHRRRFGDRGNMWLHLKLLWAGLR